MFRNVLVSVDGSPASDRAVRVAAAELAGTGARVVVAHAHRNGDLHPDAGRHLVADAVRVLAAAGVSASGEVLETGGVKPAMAIARRAQEIEADLVVLGTRGQGDLRSLLRGSVSHAVAAHTDCRVLLVKSDVEEPHPAHQRVLVAVQGGEQLDPLVQAVRDCQPETVLVVHVREVGPLSVGVEATLYVEPLDEARNTVERAVAELQQAGFEAEGRVVPGGGSLGQVVAGVAETWKADLIVLGSRRPTDLGGMLLGSTAHSVIRHCDRPVVLAERALEAAAAR